MNSQITKNQTGHFYGDLKIFAWTLMKGPLAFWMSLSESGRYVQFFKSWHICDFLLAFPFHPGVCTDHYYFWSSLFFFSLRLLLFIIVCLKLPILTLSCPKSKSNICFYSTPRCFQFKINNKRVPNIDPSISPHVDIFCQWIFQLTGTLSDVQNILSSMQNFYTVSKRRDPEI